VFPTLEVIITEAPAELRRVMRPDIGVALIDLDRSES
jgi:predicted DNA-binding protein with PD1-like motif